MNEVRLSPEAEAGLDDIWIRSARESGNIDKANRVVESINNVSGYWRGIRSLDDGVTTICASACEVSRRATMSSSLILHVVHGSRDIEALLGR